MEKRKDWHICSALLTCITLHWNGDNAWIDCSNTQLHCTLTHLYVLLRCTVYHRCGWHFRQGGQIGDAEGGEGFVLWGIVWTSLGLYPSCGGLYGPRTEEQLCCCIRALIDIYKRTFYTTDQSSSSCSASGMGRGDTGKQLNGWWRVVALSQSIGCFIGGMGIEMEGGGSIEPVCFSFSAAAFFAASLLLQMLGSTIIEGSVQPSCTRSLIEISCNISLQSVSISDLAPNTWSTHTEYISQNNFFFKIKIYTHMHAASWHHFLSFACTGDISITHIRF